MKELRIWTMIGVVALAMVFSTSAVAQTTMQQEDARQNDERSTEDRAQTRETNSEGPAAPGEDEDFVESQWSWVHVPGFRLDLGSDFQGSQNFAFGLGYMYSRLWRVKILETETFFRGGVGPDFNFIFDEVEAFRSVVIQPLVGRITGAGPNGGMTIELGGGWAYIPGPDGGMMPNITIGAYYAGEQWEIGYFLRANPFGSQPSWLTPHNLGIRFHIPLLEH